MIINLKIFFYLSELYMKAKLFFFFLLKILLFQNLSLKF
jgi:hypothetical protein